MNTEGWAYKGRVSVLDGLDNVEFIDINDFWVQVLMVVNLLPRIANKYRAIIIDTINNLFRTQENVDEAIRGLSAQMGALYSISLKDNVFVLVLGQVRATEGDEEISGSIYVKFWSKVVLRIEKDGIRRRLVIEKPRLNKILEFMIGDKGIIWV